TGASASLAPGDVRPPPRSRSSSSFFFFVFLPLLPRGEEGRGDEGPFFLPRHQSQHPQRAAATIHNLQRRRNDHRSGRWKLIEVAQAGQAELAGAVHQGVIGEGWIEAAGLAGVGAYGFDSDAE